MILEQVAGTTFSNENDKVKQQQLHSNEEREEGMEMWTGGRASEGSARHVRGRAEA